jgi:hypothetical protein
MANGEHPRTERGTEKVEPTTAVRVEWEAGTGSAKCAISSTGATDGSARRATDGSRKAAPADASAPAPSMLGRYQLLDELDHGGMGVAHTGHDSVLNRDLAVKVLLGVHQDDPDLVHGSRRTTSRSAPDSRRA